MKLKNFLAPQNRNTNLCIRNTEEKTTKKKNEYKNIIMSYVSLAIIWGKKTCTLRYANVIQAFFCFKKNGKDTKVN